MSIAEAKEKPATAAVERAAPVRVGSRGFMPESHYRQRWLVRAPAGATQDDCRHPDFLFLVAPRLNRHDIVTILADDESWELELCVESVLRDKVVTTARKVYRRDGVSKAMTIVDGVGEFYTEWKAGLAWCIVRRSDGHPVVQGHSIEANAIAEWRRSQPNPVL